MLKRRFYQTLLEWKNSPRRNAMLVTGARQVGKTTLIRQFGQEQYDCFAELNFIEDPSLCARDTLKNRGAVTEWRKSRERAHKL